MESLSELYFATSGIRGKANTVISPELGLRVGRAVASWVRKEYTDKLSVYVGYDNRRNSHTIASTIIAGLSSSGIDAKMFTEPVPTPLVIYSTATTEAKAGLMVTGSHLPRDENGIILFDDKGSYFKGILPEADVNAVDWDELGQISNVVIEIEEYQNYLQNVVKELDLKPFKWDILVDPVHGPMKKYLEILLKPLVENLITFNFQDDDTFSGRLSEPTPSNLVKTVKAIDVSQADLGIATDMDGDRVIFITSDGRVISGDYVGAILAMDYWEKYPDTPVVAPINTSAIIEYMADKMGGKIEYCKVGPPTIINTMRESGAKYGFEETGKYFFADLTIWPDSSVSILKVLKILQKSGKTLKEVIDSMPVLYTLKTKVPSPRSKADKIMNLLIEKLPEYFDEDFDLNDMDGVRINFKDKSWLLIRPSGTEDYIRVFSEHSEEERNKDLNELGQKIVKECIDLVD